MLLSAGILAIPTDVKHLRLAGFAYAVIFELFICVYIYIYIKNLPLYARMYPCPVGFH